MALNISKTKITFNIKKEVGFIYLKELRAVQLYDNKSNKKFSNYFS